MPGGALRRRAVRVLTVEAVHGDGRIHHGQATSTVCRPICGASIG